MNAPANIRTPATTHHASITLAQAEAIHAYAKSLGFKGNVQIILAAAACIDALNGVSEFWRNLAEHEDELFELIDDRRDAPSFYAVLRSAGK